MKSHDLVLGDGRGVQVKARVTSEPPKAGQFQTSPFRSWDFDLAAFVLFRDYDYAVRRAVLVPMEVVREQSSFRRHVNGSVVMMRDALLDHEDATDITDRLRAVVSQAGAGVAAQRALPSWCLPSGWRARVPGMWTARALVLRCGFARAYLVSL